MYANQYQLMLKREIKMKNLLLVNGHSFFASGDDQHMQSLIVILDAETA